MLGKNRGKKLSKKERNIVWKKRLRWVFKKNYNFKYLGGYDEELMENSKIKIKHNRCGFEFEVSLNRIYRYDIFCHGCGAKEPEFMTRDKIYDVSNGNLYLIKKNMLTNEGLFLHKTCRSYFKEDVNLIKNITICPKCSEYKSKGENRIKEVLGNMKVNFKEEVTLLGCKSEGVLFFDFAIYKKNKISFLIEYQGEQHYKPIKCWGGEEGLSERQTRDMIKKEYCKINNIPLIEINFWEYELIEEKIKMLLNQYGYSIKDKTIKKYEIPSINNENLDKMFHICDELVIGSSVDFKSLWDKSIKMVKKNKMSPNKYVDKKLKFDLKKELIKFENRLFWRQDFEKYYMNVGGNC